MRPETQITLTTPGLYHNLLEQIDVHRYYLGEQIEEEVPNEQAVVSWHDNVYSPLVHLIREQNILEEFPGRTETDLYLWILEHQGYLERAFEQDVPVEVAIDHFTEEKSTGKAKHESKKSGASNN
jgi:hypothetical protein